MATKRPMTERNDQVRRQPLLAVFAGAAIVAGLMLMAILSIRGTDPSVVVIPWFIPTMNGLMFITAGSVAFLAFGRYRVLQETVSFWIGIGSLGFATGMLFNTLTFPGLLPGNRSLLGHLPNTAAWEASFALWAWGAALLMAVLVDWPTRETVKTFSWKIGGWFIGIVLLNGLLVFFEQHLPLLIDAGGNFTRLFRILIGLFLSLIAATGALLSLRRHRRGNDPMAGYMAVCQAAILVVALMSFVQTRRYDLWWFSQRVLWVAGFLVMLFGLLSEYLHLYRREQDRSRQLRESEERFRAIFDHAGVGIVEVAGLDRFIAVNDRICEMLGYPRDELLAMDVRSLTTEEDRAVSAEMNRRVHEGTSRVTYDKRYLKRDGSRLWVHVNVSGVRDAAGNWIRSITTVEDISARRQAEQALQESEARFRGTFENAAVGIALCEPAGRFIEVNSKLCDILGHPEEDLLGQFFSSFTHPDDVEPDRSRYVQLMRGEVENYEVEKRYLRKGGSVVWVRVTRSARRDRQGMPAFSIAIAQDITARKEAEENLRHTTLLLRAVMENTPDFIFLKDRQGRMLLANPATLNDLGKAAEEVIGRTDAEFLGGEAGEQIMANDRLVMESGKTITFEEVPHPEGDRRVYLSAKSPYRDARGEVIGLIGVCRDITERKEAEKELARARDELDMRVRERTAELTQTLSNLRKESAERLHAVEELRRNEQMLLQQSRLAAMGEMLANISHQWRQPLNVVGLILQELQRAYRRGDFSEEYLESSVRRARDLITHMSQTIDDFRSFLNPERAKVSFDVRKAVQKALSMVEDTLKGVEVVMDGEQEVLIEGFPNEYSQVVMNVLINARDAFREHTVPRPVITLRIFREDGRSIVTIADNAGGIPSEIIDRIFDPYFTTKPPEKGTGIGLFMSKTIIEKNMGGRLTVRNTEEGAEFRIEV